MLFYTKAKETAYRLISKYGQDISIKSRIVGAYNPSTGTSPITETTQTFKGLVFEWGTDNFPNNGKEVIDGTIIKIGDKRLILGVKGNTPPDIGDVATVNGKQYTIVNPIKLLEPAGELVMIECNIRGI